jgi:flagellar P-ring protein precursor FlgI
MRATSWKDETGARRARRGAVAGHRRRAPGPIRRRGRCARGWALIGPLALLLLVLMGGDAARAVGARIRDIARIQGVRDNQLVGYGLVVGLDGTGDKSATGFTLRSMSSLLEAMGMTIAPGDMSVKNVAAVMVTATLPAFAREGSLIDVTVSSLGDAKSLKGGVLIQTPLRAADGAIYAVAQGPLSVGGFGAEGPGGTTETTNHLTVARIPNGAIVEREVDFDFLQSNRFELTLLEADFMTAKRVADAIVARLGPQSAVPLDAGTIMVTSPDTTRSGTLKFLADVEGIEVQPSARAKVVINERTGTIVAGGEIVIQPVAISHGNLNIRVNASTGVSQPAPFSPGVTTVVPESQVGVSSGGGQFSVLESATTLNEIAAALNAMGVSSRDMIAIFQAIKEAGALQAELVVL